MDLRRLEARDILARCHSSPEMQDCPRANKEVMKYLQKKFPQAVIGLVGLLKDTARIEHEEWCFDGDGDVSFHVYFVHEETTVYSAAIVELD